MHEALDKPHRIDWSSVCAHLDIIRFVPSCTPFFRSSTKWAYNYVEQQQKINCENRNNSQLSETKWNFTQLGARFSALSLPHIHDVILSDVFTRDILIICVSLVQPLFIFVVLRDITFAPNSFQAQILVLQPPSVVLCCAQ